MVPSQLIKITTFTRKEIHKSDTCFETNPIPTICIYSGHRGHDRMVVGFTTTYAISTYHH